MSVESIISDVISKLIVWFLVFIASIIIEDRFGVTKRLIRFCHKIKNSGIYVRVNVVYDSNLQFESLKTQMPSEL